MTLPTPALRRARARSCSRISVPGLVGLLTVAALAAGGCASARSKIASAVRANVVTVDGHSISRHDFERDVSALSVSKKLKALDAQVAAQNTSSQRLFDSKGKATRVLATSWLNRLVNQIVIDEQFKAMHLTLTAADTSEGKKGFAQLFATSTSPGDALVAEFPKWFQDQEFKREARVVAVTRVIDARHPITQAQMLDFYKKNVGSLCASGTSVSHILVKTLPEAQAIEAQLARGAAFATLAKTKSIDTASAKNGGSLGCLVAGQFVAEFEQAAQKAKIGVPTAPVKSQFGYHIILTSKFVPPSFESLQGQIRQQLISQLHLLQDFVAAGLKKASVHVDPLYGTWNTKTFRVDAPKVPSVRNSRNTTTTPTT
jgi:parvulin-like peptidyl-prolyl isomerase